MRAGEPLGEHACEAINQAIINVPKKERKKESKKKTTKKEKPNNNTKKQINETKKARQKTKCRTIEIIKKEAKQTNRKKE